MRVATIFTRVPKQRGKSKFLSLQKHILPLNGNERHRSDTPLLYVKIVPKITVLKNDDIFFRM
jgi:hypothetical protein